MSELGKVRLVVVEGRRVVYRVGMTTSTPASREAPDVTVRRVTSANDAAIEAFGELQSRVYFDPDALIPARYIGFMLQGRGERENVLLVAERAGQVIGGTLFHFLAAANTGFSSFMAVSPVARGTGVARALHEARFAALREASPTLHGVFIDVVAPERLADEERAAEARVGMDPRARRAIFARLGFRQVDVRYEQPVGGEDGGPVTNMDLLYCPSSPAEDVAVDVVVNTMRAYWSPWLGAEAARRHADALRARAGKRDRLALLEP